jgi:hypothetical protein
MVLIYSVFKYQHDGLWLLSCYTVIMLYHQGLFWCRTSHKDDNLGTFILSCMSVFVIYRYLYNLITECQNFSGTYLRIIIHLTHPGIKHGL